VNMWHTQDNHSTNVTPGNQTSEILQEKMRELREKLEKLKSKGKSGTDGVDSGAAPSSPATAEVKQDKVNQPGRPLKCLHYDGNIYYPQELKITVRSQIRIPGTPRLVFRRARTHRRHCRRLHPLRLPLRS